MGTNGWPASRPVRARPPLKHRPGTAAAHDSSKAASHPPALTRRPHVKRLAIAARCIHIHVHIHMRMRIRIHTPLGPAQCPPLPARHLARDPVTRLRCSLASNGPNGRRPSHPPNPQATPLQPLPPLPPPPPPPLRLPLLGHAHARRQPAPLLAAAASRPRLHVPVHEPPLFRRCCITKPHENLEPNPSRREPPMQGTAMPCGWR